MSAERPTTDGPETYVFLTTFTRRGVERVSDSPDRTEDARAEVEAMGGTSNDLFVTTGRYDGLVMPEFLDGRTPVKAALTLASGGNVTTETLRSFTLEEFREIVDDMP